MRAATAGAVLGFFAAHAHAADTPSPEPAAFAPLAGCWASSQESQRDEEFWSTPAADGLIGMARSLNNGKTQSHESTRLHRHDNGSWDYVAQPSGQPLTAFQLVRFTASASGFEAVFENLQHDFPTRVIYAVVDDTVLNARIEGERRGKPVSIAYPYQRARCTHGG